MELTSIKPTPVSISVGAIPTDIDTGVGIIGENEVDKVTQFVEEGVR